MSGSVPGGAPPGHLSRADDVRRPWQKPAGVGHTCSEPFESRPTSRHGNQVTVSTDHVERFTVEAFEDGERLDRLIVRRLDAFAGCSRTRVQRWIDHGRVAVDGAVADKVARRVARGAAVEVRLPRARPPRMPPLAEDLSLEIIFEDDWMLAVAKPAGLVVHPTPGRRTGTLLNALLWRARSWTGPAPQPGLLHRLDRDTSGVVLVAKDRATLTMLARAMNARRIVKDYVAIVLGRMRTPKDRIDLGLERDPAKPTRMRAVEGAGRASVTLVEELAEGRRLSLLKCTLVTGRMHQIRAHLEARGWPIVGDAVYGGTHPAFGEPILDAAIQSIGRQALHARRLRLAHPVTHEALDLVAPLPSDMRAIVDAEAWNVRAEAARDIGWPLD